MKELRLWWVGSLLLGAIVATSSVESTSTSGVERVGSGPGGNPTRPGAVGGGRNFREARNLRRSHRSKFPLRAEDPRRKSKRASGK
jgi:hypothetical protein